MNTNTEILNAGVTTPEANPLPPRRSSLLGRARAGLSRLLGGGEAKPKSSYPDGKVIAVGRPPYPYEHKLANRLLDCPFSKLIRFGAKAERDAAIARGRLSRALTPAKRDYWSAQLGFAEAKLVAVKGEVLRRKLRVASVTTRKQREQAAEQARKRAKQAESAKLVRSFYGRGVLPAGVSQPEPLAAAA